MTSNSNDPEIESAKEDLAADATEDGSTDDPTVENEGAMTPGQDSVEDANAKGINPDQ